MTSINLISPKGKASDYTVRFREPITIKKNSKIYLNYAHLTRLNEIIFQQDQTITLSDLEFMPNVQPADGLTPVALTTNIITIPAINPSTLRRAYTVLQLEQEIAKKINDLIAANPELHIYTPITKLDINRDQSSFLIGLFLDDNSAKLPYTEFGISATHSRDASNQTTAGESVAYVKSSATAVNPFYDSYALSNEHLFHFSMECTGKNSQITSGSFIKAKTNVNMNAQQGNICFGLYSKELADHTGAFNGWVEKTHGDDVTTDGNVLSNPGIFAGNSQIGAGATAGNLKKAKLGSFLNIEVTGIVNANPLTSQLRVSVPLFDTQAGNTPKVWPNINQNFRKMRELFKTPLRHIFNDATGLARPFECAVVFYLPVTDLDYLSSLDRKIFFKIYPFSNIPVTQQTPIYDSKQNDFYFPQSFFTGLTGLDQGIANFKKAKVLSQIPFSVITAAQAIDEGFTQMDYRSFSKTANGSTTAKPNCILTKYKLNFSDDLGQVVGALKSSELFPNVCEMNARFFYFEDVIQSWKNDSYDIYLNGFPIKNFKNTEKSSDGGFKKPLLCSVPVPFLNGNSSEGMGASYSVLTGLYQPTIKNILTLQNQEKNINSLSVQIKDTNNEQPAESLYQAHICFTITDDNEIQDNNKSIEL